jgi:hypothetical protein
MFILYKKPIILNLLINNSNISLIGTDFLRLNKAAKVARIGRRLL